ncbi:hypothetical protein PJK55_01310 [Exiguobacterium sp. MMG028]|uniref:hypothetical protein n=1 Tax=Exiguobacterium sp. MMG028 TaxID=3021979 RepID=UPI0022FEAE7D|nr:hypothetical protein [Exiguobacterium sp. MMG028]MDA5559356.1 hypothetical protein [Exiguobacterium sp. MMG028]
MGLLDKLQTHIETKDTHKNELLRTRYYAASPNAILQWLESQIQANGQTVRRIDANRGELSFIGDGWDGLITIVQVDGGRTAVDFTLNREQRLGTDLGQIITHYYEALTQQFPLRAIGNKSVER